MDTAPEMKAKRDELLRGMSGQEHESYLTRAAEEFSVADLLDRARRQ